MLSPGLAKKVTIHLNEDTGSQTDFLSREILSLLLREGVAGATVMRPEAGFGAHHRVHTQEGGLDTARHMPLRIEFIEIAHKVDRLLPFLMELVTDGLIEAHETVILKMAVGTAR
jgi:PII-like signaling protein